MNRRRGRRLLFPATCGAIPGLFLIPLNPVSSKPLRLAFLAALAGRTGDNGWFEVPVTTHRWSILSSP